TPTATIRLPKGVTSHRVPNTDAPFHSGRAASGTSHTSNFLFQQPTARRRPSGEQASDRTSPAVGNWASKTPDLTLQNLTWPGRFQSPSPVINTGRVGWNATAQTSASWPLNERESFPAGRPQVLTAP